MTELFDLEGHLVFYRSYHFNHKNVAIHLVCIPIILFSTIAYLTRFQFVEDAPYINAGSIMALIYSTYYVLLDFQLGILTVPLLNGAAYFLTQLWEYSKANTSPAFTSDDFTKYVAILHIGSWLAQFYGHGVHEKRSPALVDNLLQAIVLAPFFVVFEAAFSLGFRSELQKNMNNKAGKIVRDLKLKQLGKKE